MSLARITRERAERVGRAHACEQCGEYTFKKFGVKPASESIRAELKAVWIAVRTCGVCGLHQELGIDDDGEIVYVS